MPAALELRSVDPERNRFRVYRVFEAHSTLFGEHVLVIEWGRIGRRLRVRTEVLPDADALARRLAELLARRRRHGYAVEGTAAAPRVARHRRCRRAGAQPAAQSGAPQPASLPLFDRARAA